jgi:Glycosyl transferase family 64 domain
VIINFNQQQQRSPSQHHSGALTASGSRRPKATAGRQYYTGVSLCTSLCVLGPLLLLLLISGGGSFPYPTVTTPTEEEEARFFLRRLRSRRHRRRPSPPPYLHPRYTVVVRGDRLDATFRAVQRYAACPHAQTVRVDWTAGQTTTADRAGDEEDVPPLLAPYGWRHKRSHKNEKDSKHAPPPSPLVVVPVVATDAIVALDERLETVSCEDLDRSIAVWRADPSRWVGDWDGVLVVDKALWWSTSPPRPPDRVGRWWWSSSWWPVRTGTPRYQHDVPVLGLSSPPPQQHQQQRGGGGTTMSPKIWYLGKRYTAATQQRHPLLTWE